jgi:predicted RNase H-like HicB family nuclease
MTTTTTGTHTAVYRRDIHGMWIVELLDEPRVHTYGRTLTKARENIRDAAALWFETQPGSLTLIDDVRLPAKVRTSATKAHQARLRATAAQEAAATATKAAAVALVRPGRRRDPRPVPPAGPAAGPQRRRRPRRQQARQGPHDVDPLTKRPRRCWSTTGARGTPTRRDVPMSDRTCNPVAASKLVEAGLSVRTAQPYVRTAEGSKPPSWPPDLTGDVRRRTARGGHRQMDRQRRLCPARHPRGTAPRLAGHRPPGSARSDRRHRSTQLHAPDRQVLRSRPRRCETPRACRSGRRR